MNRNFAMTSPAFRSRVDQLVALLLALQSLNPLAVHRLGHLLVSFLLLLLLSLVLEGLDSSLHVCISTPPKGFPISRLSHT